MQQFPFIDLFIDLFVSALHFSGDKLAHLQEHFSLYIQLWYNAPILLPTGDKVPSQPCHRSAAISMHCTKAVYTVKVLLKMSEFVARNTYSRSK